jgi:hypothetical protein
MATRLSRKICPHCGNECLQDELTCWACGEPFVRTPTGQAAVPTIVGTAAHRTTRFSLYDPALGRRIFRGPVFRWIGLGCFFLTVGAGLRLAAYWYGARQLLDEDSLPPLRVAPMRPSTAAEPVPAPVLGPEAGGSGLEPPGAAVTPIPRRARTNLAGPAAAPPEAGVHIWEDRTLKPALRKTPSPAPSPSPGPAPPFDVSPSAGRVPAPTPPASGAAPGTRHGANEAVVAIRNTTPSLLDFDFGPANLSGTVAAYSQIAVPLPVGQYTLTLRGAGRREVLYDVRLDHGHKYLVAFDARHARVETE